MITGMNRKVFCYRCISFNNTFGICGRDEASFANADVIAYFNVTLIIKEIGGGVTIAFSAHCAK